MAANAIKRPKSPELDMNPMVDMAFLLVTFFLLATTFKQAEPTRIVLPRSISKTELPDEKLITISVNRLGQAFISVADASKRVLWLEQFAQTYGITLNDDDKKVFAELPGIGVSAQELSQYLRMPAEQRMQYRPPGIPYDSASNQLADWLLYARVLIPDARVAIKADRRTKYKHVEEVIRLLTQNNILRFNLITEIRKADGV